MRRSVLVRLLGLSLIVAVLAIAATAWLTTQGAGEQVRGEFERTMEADSFVYQQLLSYAETHESWDGVQPLVDELAGRTGQRIALTSRDGELIADSAGQDAEELPQTAAAEIDPQAGFPIVASTGSAVAGREEPSDQESGATGGAVVELSPGEAELVAACLNDAGLSYQVITDDQGNSRLIIDESDGSFESAATCLEQSYAEAVEPFVAEPALLFLGTTDRFDALSGDGLRRTVLTGSAVLVVAAGITVVAGRRTVRPIHALTDAAQRVTAGDRSARVPVSGRDEVSRLGHAFNAMAEAIEAHEDRRKSMVSDVAHELRNPLANVRGYLEAAEDGLVPLDRSLISSLLEESTLLQRLVDDLQDLALADAGMLRLHTEECDAAELAGQVVAAHRGRADEKGVTLTLDAPVSLVVDGDPFRLRQALGNLVVNAVQYTPGGGSVTVAVRQAGDTAVLSVGDTGPGIDPEHRPHLFDRFYRAEASRSRSTGGSGLGLAVTKHLVEAHAGTVEVESEPGNGATFTLRIPAGPAAG